MAILSANEIGTFFEAFCCNFFLPGTKTEIVSTGSHLHFTSENETKYRIVQSVSIPFYMHPF